MNLIEKNLEEIRDNGYTILQAAFTEDDIRDMRSVIKSKLELMGKTRSVAHAYHLAGFHRFAAFSEISKQISENSTIKSTMRSVFSKSCPVEIGLTDITVNRSQHWHTDLLRGHYARFLAECDPWRQDEMPCLKALVYLQAGRSLRIITGSHRFKTPLDDTAIANAIDENAAVQLEVKAGDAVIMDIRTVHRGSTEAESAAPHLEHSPKILVSSVFGAESSAFAACMRKGNIVRMADWDKNNLPHAASDCLSSYVVN